MTINFRYEKQDATNALHRLVCLPLSLSYPADSVTFSFTKFAFLPLITALIIFLLLQETIPFHATAQRIALRCCQIAVRGAFVLPGQQAFQQGDFTLKEEAKLWPVICQADHSTGKLKVRQHEANNNTTLILQTGLNYHKNTLIVLLICLLKV